jgi:hypothetical protein
MMMAAQRLLLTLHLSLTVCSAPCVTIARVEVDDHMRGEICLVWQSDEGDNGLTCWNAEQNERFVRRDIHLTTPGTYTMKAVGGHVVSNTVMVEVR